MVCVVKFWMPPKKHRGIDNDGVYEISEDTLSGIQFVVVFNEDEWSHSTCCFN